MTSVSPSLKFIYVCRFICIRSLSITATHCNTLQHTQWHQYRLSSSLYMYIDSFAFEVLVLLQHAATHCNTRNDFNIAFPQVYIYIDSFAFEVSVLRNQWRGGFAKKNKSLTRSDPAPFFFRKKESIVNHFNIQGDSPIFVGLQPIPRGVTFSKALVKLKAQSSNVSFHW